jgi:transposase-like protein
LWAWSKGSRLENVPTEQQRWDEEVKEECQRLYRDGLTLPQVARATGVPFATVKCWVQQSDFRKKAAA